MKLYFILYSVILLGIIPSLTAITTYHHDKPEKSHLPRMAKITNGLLRFWNITLNSLERQKRLQPYRNFYDSVNQKEPHNQYHLEQPNTLKQPPHIFVKSYESNIQIPSLKFTPFSRNNAIPGPFQPLRANKPIANDFIHNTHSVPYNNLNDNSIYNILPEFKLVHSNILKSKSFKQTNEHYLTTHIKPIKTTVETFTATNIDIPSETVGPDIDQEYSNTNYELGQISKQRFPIAKAAIGVIHREQKTAVVLSPEVKPTYIIIRENANLPINLRLSRKPIIIKTNLITQTNIKPENTLKYVSTLQNGHEIKKLEYDSNFHVSSGDMISNNEKLRINKTTKEQENYANTVQKNKSNQIRPFYSTSSNNLTQILKYLQDTNSLPNSITVNDIDYSIETLVKILSKIKTQKKFSKPIIVLEPPEENAEPDEKSSIYPKDESESTPEGGTPGIPGVDYPALYNIPQTSFSCRTQRYKGFFGDPDTNCQVWHYCDLNGGQASFLCPNGTIFSQIALTCDWWYNVKCSSTAQQYVLNERLYKYILPLYPKFPEDYTGPLVDKYLSFKFEEMEEKMRKEKKGQERTKSEEFEHDKTNNEATEHFEDTTITERTLYSKETLETIENIKIK